MGDYMKRTILIILFIFIVGGSIGGFIYYKKYQPNQSVIQYSDELYLIVEDEEVMREEDVLFIEDILHFSLDTIEYYIDNDIYYDDLEDILIITNEEKVARYKLEDDIATVNNKEFILNNNIKKVGNKVYIPVDIVLSNYELDINYFEETNAVVLDFKNIEYLTGDVILDGAVIRTDVSTKSPIITKDLAPGSLLNIYAEYDLWYRVRTIDGIPGYIEKRYIKVNYTRDLFRTEKPTEKKEVTNLINLTWDYTYGPVRNTENIKHIPGVNVISPTWFSIIDNEGKLYDKGNKEYVKKYNDLGYEVWALLDNDFNPDLTHEVLMKSSTREKLIKDIVEIYKDYGFQGINIDFENVHLKTKDLFTQFVRELYPIFKEEGMKVSLDITGLSTSENWSMFYDRERLAKTVDYMILMAYDQHWASSPIAGSVAQYSWVENSILGVLKYIPNEKLVLALPFYSRVWLEKDEKMSSQALSMETANKFIAENNIDLVWDMESMQYYGELEKDDTFYRIWLENAKSLEKKTSLVHKYNLAGIASWRKGFETMDVWDSLDSALN